MRPLMQWDLTWEELPPPELPAWRATMDQMATHDVHVMCKPHRAKDDSPEEQLAEVRARTRFLESFACAHYHFRLANYPERRIVIGDFADDGVTIRAVAAG